MADNNDIQQAEIRDLFQRFVAWQDQTLMYAFCHSQRQPKYDRDPKIIIPLVKAATEELLSKFRGNRPVTASINLNDLHLLYSSTLDLCQKIYSGERSW